MPFSLTQLQRHLALAGYEQRSVPYIERADLFSTKGGDRVIEHLLTFEYGNAEYALRPEFTASAARDYAASPDDIVRWQFFGPVFEDRADNGDYAFQRDSIGVELLGMAGALADSEVIGLAASGLLAQGITDFRLVVGHAGLTRALIERYTSDPALVQFLLNQRAALSDPARGRPVVEQAVSQFLNLRANGTHHETNDSEGLSDLLASVTLRTATLGGRTRDDIARRLVRKQRRSDEVGQVMRAVDALEAWVSLSGTVAAVMPQIYQFAEDAPEFAAMTADLRTTLDLLAGYGISIDNVLLQPDLNRVWEYYSGVVFELQSSVGSLGGGGRYDGLLRLLGSPEDTPAVGFQINIDAVHKLAGSEADSRRPVALVAGRSHALDMMAWAAALRELGIACAVFETVSAHEAQTVLIDSDGAMIDGQRFTRDNVADLAALLKEQGAE